MLLYFKTCHFSCIKRDIVDDDVDGNDYDDDDDSAWIKKIDRNDDSVVDCKKKLCRC